MPIKMLTFVDDLSRFPRIWGCGNYQAIPYRLNTQRTFFKDMSTFFLHDILRALQILLTVRLSGYV